MQAAKGAKIAHRNTKQWQTSGKTWDCKRCQIVMTLILTSLGDHVCQRNPRGRSLSSHLFSPNARGCCEVFSNRR